MTVLGPYPELCRDAERSIPDQLAEHFRAAIDAGRYRPGERLPTIRQVAGALRITRASVQAAYRRLAEDGQVEATVGRGTVVIGPPVTDGCRLSRAARGAWRALRGAPLLAPAGDEIVADFAGLRPDPTLFPTEAFAAAVTAALRDDAAVPTYGDPAGNRRLRELLALRQPSGGLADPERILITSGAQQGIDLVLRTLAEPGDAIAVAVPTYPALFGALAAHGLGLVPVESVDGVADHRSLRRALARPEVRALYVMPSYHNPTGATLDRAQREALIELVAATELPIIEDEYQCELRFGGEALPSLAELDPRARTVTVRSFSKGIFPGVRIGWCEGPADVLGPMTALKRFGDLESSPLLQAAILEFLDRGAMDEYLGRLRSALRERHRIARAALAATMPDGVRWTSPAGGLALWVELPGGVDSDPIASACARDGVLFTPGRVFDPGERASSGLRLSLSHVPVERIAPGIHILARHAQRALAAAGGSLEPHPPLIL